MLLFKAGFVSRDSVPNGSLQWSFLVKCVIHGGSTWCHGPNWGNPRWENVDWPDFRIDTFKLVIRLSKVQQSAFFHFSPVGRFGVELLPAVSGTHLFQVKCIVWQPRQPGFFQLCWSDRSLSAVHEEWRQQACPLTISICRCVFFGFWWGQICAPNSEELTLAAVIALVADLINGRLSETHKLDTLHRLELNPLHGCLVSSCFII